MGRLSRRNGNGVAQVNARQAAETRPRRRRMAASMRRQGRDIETGGP
jgi:hypothetical protein